MTGVPRPRKGAAVVSRYLGYVEEESKSFLGSEKGLLGNLVPDDWPRKLNPQGNFHHMVHLLGQEWMPSQ